MSSEGWGSQSDAEPDVEAWSDWDDDGACIFQSLFSADDRFASLEEVLQHDQQHHDFNLKDYISLVRAVGAQGSMAAARHAWRMRHRRRRRRHRRLLPPVVPSTRLLPPASFPFPLPPLPHCCCHVCSMA